MQENVPSFQIFNRERSSNLLPFAIPSHPIQNPPLATVPGPGSSWRPPHHSNEHIQLEPTVFSFKKTGISHLY